MVCKLPTKGAGIGASVIFIRSSHIPRIPPEFLPPGSKAMEEGAVYKAGAAIRLKPHFSSKKAHRG